VVELDELVPVVGAVDVVDVEEAVVVVDAELVVEVVDVVPDEVVLVVEDDDVALVVDGWLVVDDVSPVVGGTVCVWVPVVVVVVDAVSSQSAGPSA